MFVTCLTDGGTDSSDDDDYTVRRRHARSTSPTSRALSAGRTRIDELHARLARLNASMVALKRENRDLRWKQKLAERKLEHFEVHIGPFCDSAKHLAAINVSCAVA
jgi:hypothetical protein